MDISDAAVPLALYGLGVLVWQLVQLFVRVINAAAEKLFHGKTATNHSEQPVIEKPAAGKVIASTTEGKTRKLNLCLLEEVAVTDSDTAHLHECRGLGFSNKEHNKVYPLCKLCKAWLQKQI